MDSTAKRLREAMALSGYKQADLVESTGISKGALSSYVSGRYVPKQNNIYLLAKALDVSEAWLMGADVSMERKEHPFSEGESNTHSSASSASVLTDCERNLVEKYRLLDASGKKHVDDVLDWEVERTKQISDLVAAHVRTDVEPDPDGLAHDLAIMDDDSEWQ